ncbi:uncharacterized protein C1orf21 homolog isoform X2 [Sagmatias obliquidens]|uniref:uncharacterized protein C1orf21 homolog isoform X2 n=1 Tax=Sagmatias obliquidens TaxID=3371155 RepID=UPI000F446628|nr:uncharacterized protein C1orf21 homolog isoform X2 [Lagenorhynchus obliquidens]
MGCASAKHVATVQNEEEAQKGKNYQNGDVFGDEYRIKPVEEVKYMKNGAEEEQKIAARNQENLSSVPVRSDQLCYTLSNCKVRSAWWWFIVEPFLLYLEKSASSNVRLKTNKEIPGLVHQPRANMHISESQQEFFRMLDEKIEKKMFGFLKWPDFLGPRTNLVGEKHGSRLLFGRRRYHIAPILPLKLGATTV